VKAEKIEDSDHAPRSQDRLYGLVRLLSSKEPSIASGEFGRKGPRGREADRRGQPLSFELLSGWDDLNWTGVC
jgi:hypothetical protein